MALTPVTFLVSDQDDNLLGEVVVRFYNLAGDTFITEGLTDEDGELVLDLEDLTDYWVRFFKVGHTFETKQAISVDSGASSNTFEVEGHNFVEQPTSTVPGLCRVSGYVVNAAGEPSPDATFSFNVTELPKVFQGRAVVRSKVMTVSDTDGYVEVELIQDAAYDVVAEASEDELIRVKVPCHQSANITDLIWPYVTAFTFEPEGPLNLSVGDSIEVLPTVVLSSGVETPYELDEGDIRRFGFFVELRQSEEGVVNFSVDENTSVLTLRAVAAGTVSLYATLKPNKEAERLPSPARDLRTLAVTVV